MMPGSGQDVEEWLLGDSMLKSESLIVNEEEAPSNLIL